MQKEEGIRNSMGRRKLSSPLEGQEQFIATHTRKEIAEKFNVNYDHVNNFCNHHGLHPVPERSRHELTDEMIEYLKDHTIVDTSVKFNLSYVWLVAKVRRDHIPHAVVKGKVAVDKGYSCRRSGEAHDMIRVLSKTFTNASIARVFGYSKERVRQICLQK